MLYPMARPASPVPFTVRDGPPFDNRFIEDLREFICLRLDKVNPYKESKEYCLQQEKATRLFDELKKLLPEEGQDLLVAYGDALGAAHYLEVAILAERAFLDGVRIVLRAMGEEGSGSPGLQ